MKFFLNIKINILSQIINVIITFLSNLIITKILGDVLRGEYIIIFTFINLFVLIFSFSINTSIIQKISSKSIQNIHVVKTVILYYIFTFILFYVFILILQFLNLSYLIANKISFEYKIIIALLFLFSSLNSALSSIYIANKKIIKVNFITIIFAFNLLLFYFIFYIYHFIEGQNKLFILLIITVIIHFFQFIVLLSGINSLENQTNISLINKFNPFKIWIQLFTFSFLIYLTNLLAFFTYKADIWFLGYYKGNSSVGIYSLSVLFAQIVWLIPNAISSIHLAEIASNSKAHQIKITLSSIKISIYTAFFIGISIYILSYFFIESIFGEKFAEVPNIILILYIGIIPFSSMPIISSYLAGNNNYKYNFIISFILCLITLILDFLLIPIYGIIGAALASSISYLAGAFLLTMYFLKITNLKIYELLFFKYDELKYAFKKNI